MSKAEIILVLGTSFFVGG